METLCASMNAVLLPLGRESHGFLDANHKVTDGDNW